MSTATSPFVAPATVRGSIDIETEVDYLLDLDDDAFRKFVLANAMPDSSGGPWAALLHDDLVNRTKSAIAVTIAEISYRRREWRPKSNSEADVAEYEKWHQRAGSYAKHLSERQRVVKVAASERTARLEAERLARVADKAARALAQPTPLKARQRAHIERQEAAVDEFKTIARVLAVAVDTHRRACLDANVAPEPHDIALWSALEELSVPAGADGAVPPTLAEMVVSGRWHSPLTVPETEGATP